MNKICKKIVFLIWIIVCISLWSGCCCVQQKNKQRQRIAIQPNPNQYSNTQSLSGQWRFQMDTSKVGVSQQWCNTILSDTVNLPGTTSENQKGSLWDGSRHGLSIPYYFEGWAWYQTDIYIPPQWQGKHITLRMERTKVSSVWVDSQYIGQQDSLGCMQVYDISAAATPGSHTLTVLVDNKTMPGGADGFMVTNWSSTNWNGIIGAIELAATDPVWLDQTLVYPDIAQEKAAVKIDIKNMTGSSVTGQIVLNAESFNSSSYHDPSEQTYAYSINPSSTKQIELEYDIGAGALLWDEFSRPLYNLSITLTGSSGTQTYGDDLEVTFGMREFGTQGTQFTINDKNTFLRGRQTSLCFPLLGHPPMDVNDWLREFKIAKSYGLNHYRFHTSCPPEAAFEAADLLGIYIQVELYRSTGGNYDDPNDYDYALNEGLRILKTYGNHPSFVMYALGNELIGGRPNMADLVSTFRAFDNSRLYAQGSNNDFNNPSFAAGDDYWTIMRTFNGVSGNARGSYALENGPLGHVQTGPPNTMHDYSAAISGVSVPVIGHENGQYVNYPDYNEITKYIGVQYPRNLEIPRDAFEAAGMLDLADDFVKASGELATICYREEIESTLRTPGLGGFQLLDLQDLPGGTTALIGILDAFMDSKGLITPEEWRQFCSETVPLLLFEKYTWTESESFTAEFKAAHYGAEDIVNVQPQWVLKDSNENIVRQGQLSTVTIPRGNVSSLGNLNISLTGLSCPDKYFVEISLPGTEFSNRYPIWVYPDEVDTNVPAGITFSQTWDESTQQLLQDGNKVLLCPPKSYFKKTIKGFFASDFWSYAAFSSVGTMGILCDPDHPLFNDFPTEFHSNWQWWHLISNSRAMITDTTPDNYRPLVQVIDTFHRHHKLSLISECSVGSGKLLICSIDLVNNLDKPEVRQMYYSLLHYMDSVNFHPSQAFDVNDVMGHFGLRYPGDLYAWYQFEDNVNDSKGTNDGTEVNSPTYVSGIVTTGGQSKAIQFDGTNYVTLPLDVTPVPGGGNGLDVGSVSCWFKTTQETRTTLLGFLNSTPAENSLLLWLGEWGACSAYCFDDTWITTTGGANLRDGQWHLLTATHILGYEAVLYVDGEFVGHPQSLPEGANYSAADVLAMYIGARDNDGTADMYFIGTIDDLRFYDYALNADEVADLYLEGYPADENAFK